jgi:hypothetical protein
MHDKLVMNSIEQQLKTRIQVIYRLLIPVERHSIDGAIPVSPEYTLNIEDFSMVWWIPYPPRNPPLTYQ